MKWVCHWCEKEVKIGRKFCGPDCRDNMHAELDWEERTLNPLPRFWIRQWIVHPTTPNWRMLPPWHDYPSLIRGFQKREFRHE